MLLVPDDAVEASLHQLQVRSICYLTSCCPFMLLWQFRKLAIDKVRHQPSAYY
jgi:hypothetical protein